MHSRCLPKILTVVVAVGVSLAGSQAALAQASPPSSADIHKFVSVYRVDEAIALIAKDAIYEAAMQQGPQKLYYACVNRSLTPERFNRMAIEITQKQFQEASSLLDVTTFFEGRTGQKLRDSVMNVLRQRPIRRYKGIALSQPGDYSFTRAERAEIKEFEGSPGYGDFRRLRDEINAAGENPSMMGPLREIQAACSSTPAGK